MTRTFIALDLDDPTREALVRLSRRLARAMPTARVAAPETLHITLAFLGELDDDRVADATQATRDAAGESAPFWLAPGRIGIFGPEGAPRVIWVGIGGQVGRLHALQRRLSHALAARGFALDGKAFSPHLTLARLNAPPGEAAMLRLRALRSEPPIRSDAWLIESVRVMRSDLAPGGARHAPLAIVPLGRASE